jgi:predicted glycosyltransferase
MSFEGPRKPQKRAVFFAFDGGIGLGHLRRLSQIAASMQGPFACLLVTGHRAAANWFVPPCCEYVHLPSWDSLIPEKARYWGREPFLDVTLRQAVEFRRDIVDGIMRGFRPDAIFVDHLPLGANEELTKVIERASGRKYLVTRGVLNETENLERLILGGDALNALRVHYDRILVASDPRIVDFSSAYNLDAAVSAKIITTGYVVDGIDAKAISAARSERGLDANDIWVVASAGGGQMGEETVKASIDIAKAHSNLAFDIVLGPRSSLSLNIASINVANNGRIRIFNEVADMAIRHASADIVISSGGYNSILETLQGNAVILCVPLRKDPNDEQNRHAEQLSGFVDIRVASDAAQLADLFASTLASLPIRTADKRRQLKISGAETIAQIVADDLGII